MSSTVPDQPTSSVGASSSTDTTTADSRPLIAGDDPCEGDPPFVATYLPAGFSGDVTAGPPEAGPDHVPELYDPLFHLDGPGTNAIAIYHGNSWRLAVTYQAETEVLGRKAWISTVVNGNPLVDFMVPLSGDGCDFWALEGRGVSGDELLRTATALREP